MLKGLLVIGAGFGALLAGCFRLRETGSDAALPLALLGTLASLTYSVFYFGNEFRHDRIVSGQGRVADAARVRRWRRVLTWHGVVLVNLGQIALFAFLFQYFYDHGGDRYFTYAGTIRYSDWLLYTLDCTFKSVLDLPEIFDLHLRNIRHQGLVGGVVVALVRGVVYSLLVAALLRRWSRNRMARETAYALNNAPRMAGSRLVRMGEEALPHLRRVLRRPGFFQPDHEDEVLRRDEHSRPVLELLLDRLWSGDEVERLNAAVLLGLLAPEDPSRRPYWQALVDAARGDPAAAVRLAAAESLGCIDDARILRAMRSLLASPTPGVRAQAARTLGYRSDRESIAPLTDCLEDPISQVRVAAVRALGRIGDRGMVARLERALVHDDVMVQEEAVFALARLGDERVAPAALRLLASDDADRRRRAVDAVAALRPAGAAMALEPLLADPEPRIRARATTVLGHLDPGRAARALENRPEDSDPGVQYARSEILHELDLSA